MMAAQAQAASAVDSVPHSVSDHSVPAASLLDQIVEESKVAKSSVEHERAKDIISELVSQVLDGTVVVSNNLSATLDARVAELDRLISSQLSASCTHRLFRNWSKAGPACITWSRTPPPARDSR